MRQCIDILTISHIDMKLGNFDVLLFNYILAIKIYIKEIIRFLSGYSYKMIFSLSSIISFY